jgi:hypothetical protein
MSKIRVENENIFIARITEKEEIPNVYHFEYNSKWIANNNPIKNIHSQNKNISFAHTI